MTDDDPQVHAHLGLVRIPNNCCENWVEYTPEAAVKLIGSIALAWRTARRQLDLIAHACADGHAWNSGYNSTFGGEKETVYRCTREGCEERKIEPGWLPFEPKQHLVPYSSKLWDCTGPGCHHCDDEATAAIFQRHLSATVEKLNDEFLPMLGDTAAGLEFDTTPIVAKKLGYTWAVDATPEQVQAALDARNVGRGAGERVPFDPPYTAADLGQLDALHERAGLGVEWRESDRRAQIENVRKEPEPPATGGLVDTEKP